MKNEYSSPKKKSFKVATLITDHNPLILISFTEDLKIDEVHKTIHKEQVVKIIRTEIILLNRILKGVITRIITEIVHIETLGIETIRVTVQEILQATAIKIIQIIVTETTLTTDHNTVLTVERVIRIIMVDHVIILEKESTPIKTDHEIIFSQRIETNHSIQIYKIKTTEIVHQNIIDK